MDLETASDTRLDIDSLSDQIGTSLFGPDESPAEAASPFDEPEVAETPSAVVPPAAETPVTTPPDTTAPVLRAAPKAWPKEMHEHWGKVDPKVQEYLETREKQMLDGLDQYKGDAQYGKSFKDVVAPYTSLLHAAGIDPVQAVNNLLQAQYRLTQGTQDSRKAAYEQLGRDLGLATPVGEPATPVDPTVKALQDKLASLETSVTASQQAALTAARQQSAKEVEAFASDTTAHPYFDEVADDIAALLQATLATSLQDAYEQAVRRNPVTFEKEKVRLQTEAVEKFKENSRLEALPKKKAASVNVHSRDTQTAPTEPLGSMEDTVRAAFRARAERSH